jgi:hypothetical protein
VFTRLTHPAVLIALFVATVALTAVFAWLGPQTGGRLLDLLFATPDIAERLNGMSDAQKQLHSQITLIADGLYPLAYGGLMAGVIARFGGAGWRWPLLVVALAMTADYAENFVQLALLNGAEGLIATKAVITPIKFALSSLALLLTVAALAASGIRGKTA